MKSVELEYELLLSVPWKLISFKKINNAFYHTAGENLFSPRVDFIYTKYQLNDPYFISHFRLVT